MMDLEEQFLSIKHAIWNSYVVGSKVRVLDTRPDTLVRPSWRISYLTHRDQQITPRMYRQIVDWTIEYYGNNRADVMDRLQMLERIFKQGGNNHRLVNLIPAWRFDWQYPQVFVTPQTDVAGTLMVGTTYHIRVSGIDVCDSESAASVEQTIVLGPGENAFKVRIPRVPYSQPLFKQYNVYVDGHKEATVTTPNRNGLLYPEVVVKGLLGTGAAPTDPSDTVRVRWMFLRVTGYASSSREDEVRNGVFTGNVSLQTTIEQEHDRVQAPAIEQIGVTAQLPDGEAFFITVGV